MQKTPEIWVQFLGWKNPLEEGMANHSSILVWKIPWAEEPGGLQSMGSQRIWDDWARTASIIQRYAETKAEIN